MADIDGAHTEASPVQYKSRLLFQHVDESASRIEHLIDVLNFEATLSEGAEEIKNSDVRGTYILLLKALHRLRPGQTRGDSQSFGHSPPIGAVRRTIAVLDY